VLPTVLGGLDDLKTNDRKNDSVRAKAKAALSRISGWIDQSTRHGDVPSDGITVDKSITAVVGCAEPNMMATLPWPDASIADDRIVAGVLALQAEHPGALFVLVTGARARQARHPGRARLGQTTTAREIVVETRG
jgi:hypothetical protein